MKKVKLNVPRVITFVKVNITKLNNSLHVQYHRKQYDLVMAVDKTKLKIPDTLPEMWSTGIKYETMVDQRSSISAETAKLKAKDRERGNQMMNIFLIIRAQKHSHVENVREAALRLSAKLRTYKKIQHMPYEIESGRLLSMEDDMKTMTAEIATLNLTDAFANLKKLNEEFEELHVRRRIGHSDDKLPLAVEIRPQTDAAFEAICQYIQSAYLTAATDEDRALIDHLVDLMNKTSEDFKILQRNLTASHRKNKQKRPSDKKKRPKKPKNGGGDDIHLPEVEEPKKPEEGGGEKPKQPEEGGGGETPQPEA